MREKQNARKRRKEIRNEIRTKGEKKKRHNRRREKEKGEDSKGKQ